MIKVVCLKFVEKEKFAPGDIVKVPGLASPRYSREVGTVISTDFYEVDGHGFLVEVVNIYLENGQFVSLDSIYVEKIT
jgi:hypothetical protein